MAQKKEMSQPDYNTKVEGIDIKGGRNRYYGAHAGWDAAGYRRLQA